MRVGQYRVTGDIASRVQAGHPWVYRDAFGATRHCRGHRHRHQYSVGKPRFCCARVCRPRSPDCRSFLTRTRTRGVAAGRGAIGERFARAARCERAVRRGKAGLEAPVHRRERGSARRQRRSLWRLRRGAVAVGRRSTLARRILGAIERDYSRAASTSSAASGLSAGRRPRARRAGRGDEAPSSCRRRGRLPLRHRRDRAAGCRPFPRHAPRLGGGRGARRGPPVLNLFSYTGAFSVHAAKAGAAEVVAVNLAAKAHARARRNYELSGSIRPSSRPSRPTRSKTVDRFADRGRRFDIVICDPPTFSQGPPGSSRSRAIWRAWRPAARGARAGRPAGLRDELDEGVRRRPRQGAGRGRRRRGRRAARSSSAWAATGLSRRPRFPRGQLPQVRRRRPRLGRPSGGTASGMVRFAHRCLRQRPPSAVRLGRPPRVFTSARYARMVLSTYLVEADLPSAISRRDVTAGLFVHAHQRPAALGDLACAFGGQRHQCEPVVDLLETIFDGDASQKDLQGRLLWVESERKREV